MTYFTETNFTRGKTIQVFLSGDYEFTNKLAASLLADLQCRPPVNVYISLACTTSPFCTVKLNNNNNNNNSSAGATDYLEQAVSCKSCFQTMIMKIILTCL